MISDPNTFFQQLNEESELEEYEEEEYEEEEYDPLADRWIIVVS